MNHFSQRLAQPLKHTPIEVNWDGDPFVGPPLLQENSMEVVSENVLAHFAVGTEKNEFQPTPVMILGSSIDGRYWNVDVSADERDGSSILLGSISVWAGQKGTTLLLPPVEIMTAAANWIQASGYEVQNDPYLFNNESAQIFDGLNPCYITGVLLVAQALNEVEIAPPQITTQATQMVLWSDVASEQTVQNNE